MFLTPLIVLLLNLATQTEASLINDFLQCIVVPEVCPNSNITFWLYTRETQTKPHQLDLARPETIRNNVFVPNRPFKILIHGYTGWKDYSPNTEIRPALFQHGDYNVISLDYNPVVKEPCYLQAVQNVKVVANCTAQLIDYLVQKNKIQLNRFHVIGFSLGAQVSGLIAEYIKSGKLLRITGLDPALPFFWGSDIRTKLDKTDAEFVDVIHTNAGVKGKIETCGHVDFYCNKGSSQPGCDAPGVENEDSCNHARAPAYYAESINSTLGFWGTNCLGFRALNRQNCNTQIMGFHVSNSARGVYFLDTNAEPPFAKGKVDENNTDGLKFEEDENGAKFEFKAGV